MRTTIDSAGRLVIPKSLRDAAGITADTPLEVSFRDGRLEIEPVPLDIELEERDGVVVAIALKQIPVLRAADVDATVDRIRRERS